MKNLLFTIILLITINIVPSIAAPYIVIGTYTEIQTVGGYTIISCAAPFDRTCITYPENVAQNNFSHDVPIFLHDPINRTLGVGHSKVDYQKNIDPTTGAVTYTITPLAGDVTYTSYSTWYSATNP